MTKKNRSASEIAADVIAFTSGASEEKATELFYEGVLIAYPEVINTLNELYSLDPDTAVMNFHPALGYRISTAEDWATHIEEFPDDMWFPLIVIASGPHIRAAHSTLKEHL